MTETTKNDLPAEISNLTEYLQSEIDHMEEGEYAIQDINRRIDIICHDLQNFKTRFPSDDYITQLETMYTMMTREHRQWGGDDPHEFRYQDLQGCVIDLLYDLMSMKNLEDMNDREKHQPAKTYDFAKFTITMK